jgi:hypothetical protein
MKNLAMFLMLAAIFCPLCAAQGASAPKPGESASATKPMTFQQWEEWVWASKLAARLAEYGKPRIVPKGAKPEIIIKGTNIWIDGQLVAIGDPLDVWKKALPPGGRCESDKNGTTCFWDRLGIALDATRQDFTKVDGFGIYMDVDLPPPWYRSYGATPGSSDSYLPRHSFRGYLELDGFGIDWQTKFWELEQSVDPKRGLRCGGMDCSFPAGAFSDTAHIYMRLHGSSKYGTVLEFTIN